MDREPTGLDNVSADDALTLGAAAIAGTPELAIEMERLGLSDQEESLRDARDLRREIVMEMARRRGQGPGQGEA